MDDKTKNEVELTPEQEALIKRVSINHNYYPPVSRTDVPHWRVRKATRDCALELIAICPPGRELSLALTAMEEAMFWANAAVARQNQVE